MRRIALFVALLALGFSVMFVFFRAPEIGNQQKILFPEVDESELESAVPMMEKPTSIVTAEFVTKAVTERKTLEDGKTIDILRYVLTFAEGDNKSRRFKKPQFDIYNGEESPHEKIIASVRGDSGALINEEDAPESDRIDVKHIQRGLFEGNVVVRFFDAEGGDDLVMKTEVLQLVPESNRAGSKSFSIHVPNRVTIETVSGQFHLEGTSMWADPEQKSFRIEENVSLKLTDLRNAALNSLLGKSGTPQNPSKNEVPSEELPAKIPLIITCRGSMIYRPDHESELGDGETLPPGVLQFNDDVVVSKGDNSITGDTLVLSIMKTDHASSDPTQNSTEEDAPESRLDISSIRIVSDSPRRTHFQTSAGFGDAQRVSWTRESGILALIGQPTFFAVVDENMPGQSGIVEGRQISSSRLIQIIPQETLPDQPDRFSLVIPNDATVKDQKQGLTLVAPFFQAEFVEKSNRDGTGPNGDEPETRKLEIIDMVATSRANESVDSGERRSLPFLQLGEGVEVIGDDIRLVVGESSDAIPGVTVGTLNLLKVTPSLAEDERFQIKDMKKVEITPIKGSSPPSLELKSDGGLHVLGHSKVEFLDLNDRRRTLEAKDVEFKPSDDSLIARDDVVFRDVEENLTLTGDVLTLMPDPNSNVESRELVVTGSPAILDRKGEDGFVLTGGKITTSPESGKLYAIGECEVRVSRDAFPSFTGKATPSDQEQAPTESNAKESSAFESEFVTLAAPELVIIPGDDGRPQEVRAFGGVVVKDGNASATARTLLVNIKTGESTLIGDAQNPARINRPSSVNESLIDYLEGPEIIVKDNGDTIYVPHSGHAILYLAKPKTDADDSRKKENEEGKYEWVELRSQGLLEWLSEEVNAQENVVAVFNAVQGRYEFQSQEAHLTLENSGSQTMPRALTAKGNVLLKSETLEGSGDVLFANYAEQKILLEGRMKPSWLQKEGGTRLVARGFEVDYKNEEFSAWNGVATASYR